MENDGLFGLPLDVQRLIWRFLSLPDIIRFGMTAKMMVDRTWPLCQELLTNGDWPIEALIFLLSRDLANVTNLFLSYSAIDYDDHIKRENVDSALQLISSIATKKAPNLQVFQTDVELMPNSNVKDDAEKNYHGMHACINDFIHNHTRLQCLYWYTAQLEDDFNIGQFLNSHTRLTHLAIQTSKKLFGMNLLTHLKSLTLSFCDSLDSDLFSDVVTLTQLTSLNFIFEHLIDKKRFVEITKLTNLESIGMLQTDLIPSNSLEALYKLPKLSSYDLRLPWDYHQEEKLCISLIGRLSGLTSLHLHNFQREIDLNQLNGLTNLLNLHIEGQMSTIDLSNFTSVTRLSLHPRRKSEILNLPPNLKELSLIAPNELQDSEVEVICNEVHLKTLTLHEQNSNSSDRFARWITRLTDLTALSFFPYLTKDLVKAIEQLSNLASIRCDYIPEEIVADLAKLTQVISLTYWSRYNKELRFKLPFYLNFAGDPNGTDEELQ